MPWWEEEEGWDRDWNSQLSVNIPDDGFRIQGFAPQDDDDDWCCNAGCPLCSIDEEPEATPFWVFRVLTFVKDLFCPSHH